LADEVIEEGGDLGGPELARVTALVEVDEASGPPHVDALGRAL